VPEALDRPLSLLCNTFFEQGYVLDDLEEPVLDGSDIPPQSTSVVFVEVPPVVVLRLRHR